MLKTFSLQKCTIYSLRAIKKLQLEPMVGQNLVFISAKLTPWPLLLLLRVQTLLTLCPASSSEHRGT